MLEEGRARAAEIGTFLKERNFGLVLSSPLQRSLETCRIAGYADSVEIREGLTEWNYGEYEGVTTATIRESHREWVLWHHGAPGGETPEQVRTRIDPLIDEICECGPDVLVFSHGHLLRALAARWITLPVSAGGFFRLSTGTISTLGWEREIRVIEEWNRTLRP